MTDKEKSEQIWEYVENNGLELWGQKIEIAQTLWETERRKSVTKTPNFIAAEQTIDASQ